MLEKKQTLCDSHDSNIIYILYIPEMFLFTLTEPAFLLFINEKRKVIIIKNKL